MSRALWIALLSGGYAVPFGLLLRSLCRHPHKRHYTAYKAAASLAFLLAAACCAQYAGAWAAFRPLLPALLLCAAGDVLLALYNRSRSAAVFAAGAGVFLCGHFAFAAALARRAPLSPAELLVPLAAVPVAAGLIRFFSLHVDRRLRPAILVYAWGVTLFAVKALHLAQQSGGTGSVLMAAGAGLFLLSDILILFLYFSPRSRLAVHILNLSFYYAGMLCIALSLLYPV